MDISPQIVAVRQFGFAILFAVTAICVPFAAHAQLRCSDFAAVQALAQNVGQLNWRSERPSSIEARLLSQRVTAVLQSDLLVQLSRLEMHAQRRAIDDLLHESVEVVRHNTVRYPIRLQNLLQSVDRVVLRTCDEDPSNLHFKVDEKPLDSPGHSKMGAHQLGEYLKDAGTFIKITFLFSVLAALIGVTFGARRLYVFVFALVYSRKTCLVKAELDFGDGLINGFITLVGRNGCRFQPNDLNALANLKKSIGNQSPNVLVLNNTIPLRLNGIADIYVSVFFKSPIKLSVLKEILATSAVPPKYAKKDIMKSNI